MKRWVVIKTELRETYAFDVPPSLSAWGFPMGRDYGSAWGFPMGRDYGLNMGVAYLFRLTGQGVARRS